MSRAGYTDGDCDSVEDRLRMCGWNANVRRCMAGRAGQAFLWELYHALEALPRHRLIQSALRDRGGDYCSLGAVAHARRMEIPEEWCEAADGEEPDELEFMDAMGGMFGIKDMLAREVMYQNDDCDDVHYTEGPPNAHQYGGRGAWYRDGEPRREETPEERWQRVREWVVSHLKDIP